MSKLSTAIRLVKNNKAEFLVSLLENLNFLFPDKLYLKLLFRCKMGYWIDFDNPNLFSEKLQWLKLYDRNPLYTTLVDKFAVKKWVADKIGEEYVIPLLGVWNNAYEIDFESLPNQFVLKTTNGGGGDVVICKDKSRFDKDKAVKHLNQGLKKCIYSKLREWPYKNVPPRIIAEKYMEDDSGELRDYKIFCFNGIPQIFLLYKDRYDERNMTIDFFDEQKKWLDLTHPEYGRSTEMPVLPNSYDKLFSLARILSESFSFVRCDFYIVNGSIYFGEMTFYPTSGLAPYKPIFWEKEMGSWLKLPSQRIQ